MMQDFQNQRRNQEIKMKSYDNAELLKDKANSKINNDKVNIHTELKNLNKKIKFPGVIFSIFYGVFGCLLFGFSICILAKVFLPDFLWLGILLLILCLIIFLSNYFIYNRIYKKRRKKYHHQIEELLN